MAMIADGLVAFVKRACPTCTLIESQMQQLAKRLPEFRVVSQDDPRFPAGVERIVDDRQLEQSWRCEIESTPTLIRFAGGREIERVVGWDREGCRKLSGIPELGGELPAFRPG
jgi:hypothetical protein